MNRVTFELTKDGKTDTKAEDYPNRIGERDLKFIIDQGVQVFEKQGYTVKVSIEPIEKKRR
jgi:hypothetical protein